MITPIHPYRHRINKQFDDVDGAPTPLSAPATPGLGPRVTWQFLRFSEIKMSGPAIAKNLEKVTKNL